MKKITFLAISLLNLVIFAQPVLNSGDLINLNIAANNFNANSITVGVGGSGANQIWDFSGLTLTPRPATYSVALTTAPFALNFPNANFYVKSTTGININYGYYNLTASSIQAVGFSSETAITTTFTNAQTFFTFPFGFNTIVNDTYQISPSATILNSSNIYDAYGTVTTAFGTFTNVIRTKQINSSNNFYTWFQVNPYKEILTCNENNDGSFNFTIRNNINLSTITNELSSNFSIFPNPTSGNISIKNASFAENEALVNVYDVLGNHIIKNEKIDGDSKNIDLSSFSSGLYFIKITDVYDSLLYSDKIIKN